MTDSGYPLLSTLGPCVCEHGQDPPGAYVDCDPECRACNAYLGGARPERHHAAVAVTAGWTAAWALCQDCGWQGGVMTGPGARARAELDGEAHEGERR